VRRTLNAALPESLADALHANYLGRYWLARAGDANEPDLLVARALLSPGDSCIDGGANFGRFGDSFALAVGPKGRVLAIEPIPRTARLLRRVLALRHHAQVDVIEAALASAPGQGSMEVPTDQQGDANYFRAHIIEGAPAGAIEVRLETLDDLSASLPRPPSLVKLDLEGHERAALEGATTLLGQQAAWLIELNDDPDESSSDAYAIEALFAASGYSAWVFDADSRTVKRRRPGPRGPNVFFLLPAHLSRIAAARLTVIDA